MIKKRSLRALLALMAGIFTAICAYIALDFFCEHEESQSDYNYFVYSRSYGGELDELYRDLWLIGNMYYANTDADGDYTVGKEMQDSIESYLKANYLMDEDGQIVPPEYSGLEYYLGYGGRVLTNTDKTLEELRSSRFGVESKNGNVFGDIMFAYPVYEVRKINGGQTFYYLNGEILTFADFDTDGLPFFENDAIFDSVGCVCRQYYKTDGSTPLPGEGTSVFSSNPVYFVHNSAEVKDALEEEALLGMTGSEIFLVNSGGDTTHVYNSETGEYTPAPNQAYLSVSSPEICIAPTDEMTKEVIEAETNYRRYEKSLIAALADILPLAFIVLAFFMAYLMCCGYNAEKKGFVLSVFDHMYTEITLAMIAVVAAAVCGSAIMFVQESMVQESTMLEAAAESRYIRVLLAAAYGAAGVLLTLLCGSAVNKLKCKSFIKTSACYMLYRCIRRIGKRVFRWIKGTAARAKEYLASVGRASRDAFARRFVIRLGAFLLLGAAALLVALATDMATLLITAPVILFIYARSSLKDAASISELSDRIDAIRDGDYTKRELRSSDVNYKMQSGLNDITEGINTVVEERMRSEKMKVDLVTNVSHDLKTPLTSIVSYVDLLSREELPEDQAAYVQILRRKTQRLSEIVADLFDLAKATSETDLKLEELDAVILIRQVLGDMEDKINRYGRDIRTDIPMLSLKVTGDGKKLYRTLQNVIDNALKYSMDGTRIFISLSETQTEAVMTVKNTASYEMDFTGDEIVERFVRGDRSRSSEGNGLGLSIAKTFTQACGGSFSVKPDGDVFTVTIGLKKVCAKEQQERQEQQEQQKQQKQQKQKNTQETDKE